MQIVRNHWNCLAPALPLPTLPLGPACVSHKIAQILCETQAARGDCGVGGVPAAGGFWILW